MLLACAGLWSLDSVAEGTSNQIKRHDWGQRATVVALTGWGQDEDWRRTAAAGFDIHLVKLVNLAALDSVLASMTDRLAYRDVPSK